MQTKKAVGSEANRFLCFWMLGVAGPGTILFRVRPESCGEAARNGDSVDACVREK